MSKNNIEVDPSNQVTIDAIKDGLEFSLNAGTGYANIHYGAGHTALLTAEMLAGLQIEADQFKVYPPVQPWAGNGSRRPVFLEPQSIIEKTLLSPKHTPSISEFGILLGAAINLAGRELGVAQFARWHADRATINKMITESGKPAQRYKQPEPIAYEGVVATIYCQPATEVVYRPESSGSKAFTAIPMHAGSVSLRFAADVCNDYGIEPVETAVQTDEPGYSVTFAHDPHRNPIGITALRARFQDK